MPKTKALAQSSKSRSRVRTTGMAIISNDNAGVGARAPARRLGESRSGERLKDRRVPRYGMSGTRRVIVPTDLLRP